MVLRRTLSVLQAVAVPLILSLLNDEPGQLQDDARSSNKVATRRVSNVGRQKLGFIKTQQDNPDNIRFILYPNPQDVNEYEELKFEDIDSLNTSRFQKNCTTKFIVHGFIQNLNAEFPQNVKNAYLKRMRRTGECFNIVVVDWGKLAYEIQSGIPVYTRAVRNVEPTGERIADFISFLMANGYVNGLDQIHLIGQSLGAHVVGQCGRSLFDKYKVRVARLTGLDPAGPMFYIGIFGRKLDTWDAEFVDVYHCNPGGYGIDQSVGDIQFYPNLPALHLGRMQPQCKKFRKVLESPDMCSHNYCPKFFALALNKEITAHQYRSDLFTDETAIYGEDVAKRARGKYYVSIPDNLDDMNIFLN